MTTHAVRGRSRLWQPGDVVLLYALNLLGVTLLLASAWATTATQDVSVRVAWVNLGVIGLLVAGTGNTFWLLAGRRAVGERRVRLLAAPDPDVVEVVDVSSNGHRPATSKLVALRGGSRFHRAGCALVEGKPALTGTRSRHEGAGRRPCGVCEP